MQRNPNLKKIRSNKLPLKNERDFVQIGDVMDWSGTMIVRETVWEGAPMAAAR